MSDKDIDDMIDDLQLIEDPYSNHISYQHHHIPSNAISNDCHLREPTPRGPQPMIISPIPRNPTLNTEEKQICLKKFESWSECEQIEFVQALISRMAFHQQEKVNSFLEPILQRDFISELANRGLDSIACYILGSLDERSLCRAELVCRTWYEVIMKGKLWRKLILHNIKTQPIWRGLAERRKWGQFILGNSSGDIISITGTAQLSGRYYRLLYPCIIQDISGLEKNWKEGVPSLSVIQCNSSNSKGVYCLQYDDRKIVSGLRDNTIKIWERDTLNCVQILKGHTGSVLCLQYDGDVIISGSSDSTIRVWDVRTGQLIKTLIHHCEAVLHLRFDGKNMVTCSKDRTIAVWEVNSPSDIVLRRVLVGHRAAVNVVDFDDKFIVSASGDRTIKVWRTSTCEFIRTLQGHRRGIACLQYRDNLVVSGSSDNSIRLWDIHSGQCLRILEGHEELVRCIRFDDKRIVSGAYDGKIKVWDLESAMNPRVPTNILCIRTLDEHTGRVFRLQFDSFQIISSSHDDTILIWDFLDQRSPDYDLTRLEEQEISNSNQIASFDYYQDFLYSDNT